MNIHECEKCHDTFSANNIKKHRNSCNGTRCAFKKREFNETRKIKRLTDINWSIIQDYYNDSHTTKECISEFGLNSDMVSKAVDAGLLVLRNSFHTKILRGSNLGTLSMSSEQRREIAKRNNFGGYRENAGRSKKFIVNDSFNNVVTLQSTYELRFSQILDQNSIRWVRPKYLKYGNKKYFADFYLVDYDIFFDTKNDYLIKKDEEKIKLVISENKVRLFVIGNEQIHIDFIRMCLNS